MKAPAVTDDMIAREFRLQRCTGSALKAITTPAVRRVLELGAKVRAARECPPAVASRDAKCRAANDKE